MGLVGLSLAEANASRAEKPAGRARICVGVVRRRVVLLGGVALCGALRRLCGVCVGEVLGDGTWRACGSARCEIVDGERGPSMAVSQLL